MAGTLKLEIITPESIVYSQEVELVTLPGIDGELGIYPQHTPLLTQIVPGELAIRQGGVQSFLAVGAGFVEITGARVAVLTDMAIKTEDIDEQQAEEARRRAEARLKEPLNADEVAATNAALLRSLTQLQVKRRHRKDGPVG